MKNVHLFTNLLHVLFHPQPLFVANGNAAFPPLVVITPFFWVAEHLFGFLKGRKARIPFSLHPTRRKKLCLSFGENNSDSINIYATAIAIFTGTSVFRLNHPANANLKRERTFAAKQLPKIRFVINIINPPGLR